MYQGWKIAWCHCLGVQKYSNKRTGCISDLLHLPNTFSQTDYTSCHIPDTRVQGEAERWQLTYRLLLSLNIHSWKLWNDWMHLCQHTFSMKAIRWSGVWCVEAPQTSSCSPTGIYEDCAAARWPTTASFVLTKLCRYTPLQARRRCKVTLLHQHLCTN